MSDFDPLRLAEGSKAFFSGWSMSIGSAEPEGIEMWNFALGVHTVLCWSSTERSKGVALQVRGPVRGTILPLRGRQREGEEPLGMDFCFLAGLPLERVADDARELGRLPSGYLISESSDVASPPCRVVQQDLQVLFACALSPRRGEKFLWHSEQVGGLGVPVPSFAAARFPLLYGRAVVKPKVKTRRTKESAKCTKTHRT